MGDRLEWLREMREAKWARLHKQAGDHVTKVTDETNVTVTERDKLKPMTAAERKRRQRGTYTSSF